MSSNDMSDIDQIIELVNKYPNIATIIENLEEALEIAIDNTTGLNFPETIINHYCNDTETDAEEYAYEHEENLETDIVLTALKIWGPLYVLAFFLFCFVRKHFPRYYNIRSWVPEMKCDIASREYKGYFSWLWEVHKVSDDEILEQCGMDSLCFIRVVRLCRKMALFGCFHAIYLLPLYGTANSPETEYFINDRLTRVTAANVPNNSPIFIATVTAAYFITSYTMYLFLKEFEWFTEYRHKFLMQRVPRNYAVYVTGIPRHIKTSEKLGKFFEEASSDVNVLEALITFDLPNLDGLVSRREALVDAIDHVHAYEKKYGEKMNIIQLRQVGLSVGMPLVDSVGTFQVELRKLNTDISLKVDQIVIPDSLRTRLERAEGSRRLHYELRDSGVYTAGGGNALLGEFDLTSFSDEFDTEEPGNEEATSSSVTKSLRAFNKNFRAKSVIVRKKVISAAGDAVTEGHNVAKGLGTTVLSTARTVTKVDFSFGGRARPREGGFVVFKTLFSAQAALQMIHHRTPHVLEVSAAPDPEDIVWKNVGLMSKAQNLGQTLSAAATISLCIFWTPISTVISSSTEVSQLKTHIPTLEGAIENNSLLEVGLEQIGPLLLIVCRDGILPLILAYFVTWEGLVSIPRMEASLFVKLSVFLIIQNFFVVALSGSFAEISEQIVDLVHYPTRLVQRLANALPAQSSIFIQLIVIETFLVQGWELLRIGPILHAIVRQRVGRNLTEKDRKSKFLFLHPLENPPPFYASRRLASQTLFVMIFFVYSTIAPLVNFFLWVCCIMIESGYRYNFYHNLHAKPDSGGKYWEQFIRISMGCLIVSQLVLVSFLSLKLSTLAAPFMITLIAGSIYYIWLLNLRHFHIANNLPTHTCLEQVRKNLQAVKEGKLDINFARGKYIQPSLRHRTLYPAGTRKDLENEVNEVIPPTTAAPPPKRKNNELERGNVPRKVTFLEGPVNSYAASPETNYSPESDNFPESDNSKVDVNVSEICNGPESDQESGNVTQSIFVPKTEKEPDNSDRLEFFDDVRTHESTALTSSEFYFL